MLKTKNEELQIINHGIITINIYKTGKSMIATTRYRLDDVGISGLVQQILNALLLNVGVGSISESATEKKSRVIVLNRISSVWLVLEAWIKLHQDKYLIRRQKSEIVWRICNDISL